MNIFDCLEERGFVDALTSDELRKIKTPLSLYVGFDPTSDSLHLGNLMGIIALRWFEKFGHKPVVLLGGATGKIGDPSGKSVERPLLTEDVLQKNLAGIKKQFDRCLDNATLLNNDDWLGKFNLIDFLREVGKHFRMGPMLGKESVRARIQSDEGMSFTEFSYQLFQGYDFYYLMKEHGVTLQVGGSDQWGNITAGIELTRKLGGKEIYGMTFPLLTRSDGKKFGKTEEGAIWLSPEKVSPYQFYQYLYRMPDADVVKLLKLLTFLELSEIAEIEKESKSQPNFAQKRLAEEVTRYVHGEEGLDIAKRVTLAIAPGSKAKLDLEVLEAVSKDMPGSKHSKSEVVGATFAEVASKSGLVQSKGDAGRLVKNGGAYLNNEKVSDHTLTIASAHLIGDRYLLLASGKKKKHLIEIV